MNQICRYTTVLTLVPKKPHKVLKSVHRVSHWFLFGSGWDYKTVNSLDEWWTIADSQYFLISKVTLWWKPWFSLWNHRQNTALITFERKIKTPTESYTCARWAQYWQRILIKWYINHVGCLHFLKKKKRRTIRMRWDATSVGVCWRRRCFLANWPQDNIFLVVSCTVNARPPMSHLTITPRLLHLAAEHYTERKRIRVYQLACQA